MHKFALSFLLENRDIIVRRISESGDYRFGLEVFRRYALLCNFQTFNEQQRAVIEPFLIKNLHLGVNSIDNKQDHDNARDIFTSLYLSNPEKLRERIDQLLASDDRDQLLTGRIMMAFFIETDLYHTKGYEVYFLEEGRQILDTLRDYGFSPDDLPYIWDRNSARSDIQDHVSRNQEMVAYRMENIRAMTSLERHIPGICKVLYDQFGIRNFARYPTDLLIKQYKERDGFEDHFQTGHVASDQ